MGTSRSRTGVTGGTDVVDLGRTDGEGYLVGRNMSADGTFDDSIPTPGSLTRTSRWKDRRNDSWCFRLYTEPTVSSKYSWPSLWTVRCAFLELRFGFSQGQYSRGWGVGT